MSRGGGVLEVVFCLNGSKWLTLGKEEFAWGSEGRQKIHRLTIKLTLSKTVFKDFPNTLRVPFTDCFKSIASYKKWIFLNMPVKLWRINNLKMQENIWKIVAACNVSKNSALPQVFFCYILKTAPKNFWFFSKFFQSISTRHCTVQIHACFYTPNERCRLLIH